MTTFRSPIDRAAACYPRRDALVDAVNGATWTFRDVQLAVRRTESFVDALGIAPGERVAVIADASPLYALLYLCVPAAGRIMVPLNSRYTRGELEAAVADCDPALLVSDRAPDDVVGLAPSTATIDDYHRAIARSDRDGPASVARLYEHDAAVIFYTGGTTDRSKGVVMTHRNKLVDALSLIAGLGLTDEDRWLVMSPMFHAAGSFNVIPCLWVGATQIFVPRFDAAAVLQAIERHRPTVTFGVPTMLHALVEAEQELDADVSSLRLLGHGGAPITEALAQRVVTAFAGTELCAMYGATEMAPMATIHRHQERVVGTPRGRSAGQPVLGVDVGIFGQDGRRLPPGEIGEIVVRGPNIMQGYWRKPDVTAAVLRDGAYWSGDIGYQDDEGHLFVIDRSKDMIITGGENVYGTEVEDVLASHPAVVEAAVLGRADQQWGEVVTAVIVTRGLVTTEELDGHCRERLAAYKVPRQYEFRTDPLPRSPAGKLLKRELRGQAPGS